MDQQFRELLCEILIFLCALNVTYMPVFCSSRLESSKDHTDKEGDTVDHMFNQIIDKKNGALEYFRVDIYYSYMIQQHSMKNLHKQKRKKLNKWKLASVQNNGYRRIQQHFMKNLQKQKRRNGTKGSKNLFFILSFGEITLI